MSAADPPSDAGVARRARYTLASAARSPAIETIVAALREMSSQTEPTALLASYGRHMLAYRPADLIVSVSRRGLPSGRYKVTRAFRPAELSQGEWTRFDPWSQWDRLRLAEGGIIGDLIETPEPKLIHDLELDEDEVLGDLVRGLGSAVAIPAYDAGEALNWNFQFRRDRRGYSTKDLEDVVLQGNLLGTATRNLVSLRREADLRRQLQGQFEQIAGIQRALLPKQAPHIPGLRLATSYLTSENAGGDYYDFFELSGGRWGVLIADVSGHGAAAATIMAILHTILHSEGMDADGADPTRVLAYANRRLMAAGIEGNFVTAFYAVYEPDTGRVRYARCGHNPPRLFSPSCEGCIRPVEQAGALPLGVFEDIEIDSADLTLNPGDALVLYTDGITEAFNAEREEFGVQRLDEAVRLSRGDPDGVIDSVYAALYQHVGAMTRDDDQTLVILQREQETTP